MFILILLIKFVFVMGVFSQKNTNEYIKVQTTEGIVVGRKELNGDYMAFYGIPYAGSVAGKNRFKEAPAPVHRSEEFLAVDESILCAQPSIHGLVGKEDCLTLNIFTKNLTTTKPVIVWLDGEEYSTTNSTPRYSFRSLVQSDIVFIRVNYRLSIFGFLCLGVKEAPGNAGLKDVVKALKWIHENIAGFGGDPNNVMLLGHGSGAAMVDLLTVSPLAEGLIAKAVALSGSALSPWAMAYDPIGYAKALGAKFQFYNDTQAELAKFFSTIDADDLVNEISKFTFTNHSVLFAPCVENTNLSGSFLEDDPLKLIRSDKYQIPFIASYVNKEGTIRVKEAVEGNWLKMMQNDFKAFLPANLAFKNESIRTFIGQEVRQAYFGNNNNLSLITFETIQDFLAYIGDSLFTVPVIRGVHERAESGSQAVWLLEFTYKDVNYDWPYPHIRIEGVKHGDILNYIFDLDSRPVNDKPKKSLIGRLVAFAYNGQPVEGSLWVPYTVEDAYYLRILGHAGSTAEYPIPIFTEGMQSKPLDQSVNFWNSISEYYATPARVTSDELIVNYYADPESANNSSTLPIILGTLAVTVIIISIIIYTVQNKRKRGRAYSVRTLEDIRCLRWLKEKF
ncbi:hypothetical protein ABMA27_006227 [Loxostege sticticalis]|uniref:Carboxylesterase type B domain-containing protein n=1 Tax=Loxostege sticticalis TaxID=481309 RepID=A0ABR3HI23_LOXSC